MLIEEIYEENKLILHDFYLLDLICLDSYKCYNYNLIKNLSTIKSADGVIIGLQPVNNPAEYVINYFQFSKYKKVEMFNGCSYNNVFNPIKNFMKFYLDEVYENKNSEKIIVECYQENKLYSLYHVNVYYNYEQLFIYIEKSSKRVLEYDYFDKSFSKVVLIENKKIVRFNTSFHKFLLENNISVNDLTFDYINSKTIFENSLYNTATFSDLIDEIDKGNTAGIDFIMDSFLNSNEIIQGTLILLEYHGKPYIHFIIHFIEKTNFFINSNNKINDDIAVCHYDVITKKYSRNNTFYKILEIEKKEEDNEIPIFNDYCVDNYDILESFVKNPLKYNNELRIVFKIITARNNIKYVDFLAQAMFEDNLCTKFIYQFVDSTDSQDNTGLFNSYNKVLDDNSDSGRFYFFNNEYIWTPQVNQNLNFAVFINDIRNNQILNNNFYNILNIKKSDWNSEGRYIFLNNIIDDVPDLYRFIEGEIDEINISTRYQYSKDIVKTIMCYSKRTELFEFVHILDITKDIEIKRKLENKIDEKTLLLKEINHRVKNNLQVLSSFIHLEERFHLDSPEVVLESIKNCLNTLSLVYEKLYKSSNLKSVNLLDFFKTHCNNFLFPLYKDDVKITLDIPNSYVLTGPKISNVALIINELISNSLKHAFVINKNNEIRIKIRIKNNICVVDYKDNGKGISNDVKGHEGLGTMIIHSLIKQLDGDYKLFKNIDKGYRFLFKFPIESDEDNFEYN